ncbi:MAG: hydantoinase B/oxoprolinase family protein [Gammaproteobacteria bacterium]
MNSTIDKLWQFWIDRGGTFTDIVAKDPEGRLITHKLLSENPERYQDAALEGIREILGLTENQPLAEAIESVKMGTTVGTNALLERKGEPVALLITRGFKDCLRIGYQNRPEIFALDIRLPEPLYQTVVEIDERVDVQGEVLRVLDPAQTARQLKALYDQGFRSIAIVLMHAWRFPGHEQTVQKLAQAIGFTQISVSHQISPLMKIVGRGDTTVVDAYLSPLLRRYVDQVVHGIKGDRFQSTRLLFMQSNGGLTEASRFQGKDSILSGPAGGIVGAVAISVKAGFKEIIAFDMGGTSTDVAHYAGVYERSSDNEVAGVRIRAPMLSIHTVAAGGGSILHFDGMRYRVGPDSAGANPGPAGYRRGGPLTVTDANIMLGKLPLFPCVFGEYGDLPLDTERVEGLFVALAARICEETGDDRSPEQVAEGFVAIAVENMAMAIKKISVQKGYDVSKYTLCCYGAASGQHACAVADRLNMQRIILHPFAGVLSAYGMGLADMRLVKERSLEWFWETSTIEDLQKELAKLERQGRQELIEQGVAAEQIDALWRLSLRYQGTDTAVIVDFSDKQTMLSDFHGQFKQQFGFIYQDKALVIEVISVEVVGINELPTETEFYEVRDASFEQVLTVEVFFQGSYRRTPVYKREQLYPGCKLSGPAIIIEPTSTIVIDPDWRGEISRRQDLILTRKRPLDNQRELVVTTADPVLLEIFNKTFMSIAEQMGFVLQNTAYSVNIKERLDFSCAIFNEAGDLIANAPHIPVHLGSMGETVKCLLFSEGSKMQPGDVYLVNSPYHGGTHLPDITVITPVFEQSQLLFFVASRGHHADVGGITPGSMPSASHHIDEEGVLSSGMKIVAKGCFLEADIRTWLTSGKYPARNPEQNIADLQAACAANEKGVQELGKMIERFSLPTVRAYMQFVQDNAEQSVRQVLINLKGGSFRYAMDNGAEIAVRITVDHKERCAKIDFTGTSRQQDNNFNAPSAVCKAAVLYVFRTLVQDDIPLNAGCLKPLDILIPEGTLLNPRYPAAVVAGNVETSQAIVDALFGALGVLAGSQGTMNNLSFGNARYQYYETICGGAGAGDCFDGCDAVHTHMTNSRITDPEILEWRFPVVLEQFSIRTGSGGAGKHKGGDGVVRRIIFKEPMTVSLLSNHRIYPPFSVKGGEPGKTGENKVIRADGTIETVPGCTRIEMDVGDAIQIESPGGGGYGAL